MAAGFDDLRDRGEATDKKLLAIELCLTELAGQIGLS